MKQDFHQRLVKQRENFVLDYLFNDKGNSDYQLGLYKCECLNDDFWRRCPCQEIDMASFDYGLEQFHNQTIHVGQRKHADHAVA